jgi:hypothetical protein
MPSAAETATAERLRAGLLAAWALGMRSCLMKSDSTGKAVQVLGSTDGDRSYRLLQYGGPDTLMITARIDIRRPLTTRVLALAMRRAVAFAARKTTSRVEKEFLWSE